MDKYMAHKDDLKATARMLGSASDAQLGLNPVSGTPLGTTQIVTAQGLGIHDYRRGKIASFIEEIYRDWVLQYLIDDMNKGLTWVDELTLDEMQKLSEDVMTNEFNRYIKEKILAKQTPPTPEELEILKEIFKKEFTKSSKKFLEIVRGDFKGLPMKIKINVAGKQKDMSKMVDKLGNVWRAIFANPQGFMATMAIPGANKAFNQMLEGSGLEQFDFSQAPPMPQSMPEQLQEPLTTNQPI
jgi:hypothetical protein